MRQKSILGIHSGPEFFGCYTNANDGKTASGIEHRSLIQHAVGRDATVQQIRAELIKHHASDEMIERDRRKIKNLRDQGYPVANDNTNRFPRADKTRKGNLAEVFLAEYTCAISGANLPVYRLRYNPNVEQSMKGDDVLAFDFNASLPRIVVGEAKFRGVPSKAAIQSTISGLLRSYRAGLPASLQFVADRLYEAGNVELGNRITECSLQMARGNLDLYYVGFLLSNTNSKSVVDQHTSGTLQKLVMISLGIENPTQFVLDCFHGLEEDAYGNSK